MLLVMSSEFLLRLLFIYFFYVFCCKILLGSGGEAFFFCLIITILRLTCWESNLKCLQKVKVFQQVFVGGYFGLFFWFNAVILTTFSHRISVFCVFPVLLQHRLWDEALEIKQSDAKWVDRLVYSLCADDIMLSSFFYIRSWHFFYMSSFSIQ